MSAQNPNQKSSLYPEIIQTDHHYPTNAPPLRNTSSNLYPTIDMKDLQENLFPDPDSDSGPSLGSAPPAPVEEVLIRIPGAILNLIDRQYSVELASGEFSVVRLRQGDSVLAVLARVGEEIQWPLARDEAAVRLDGSHYFFSLRLPPDGPHPDSSDSDEEEDKGKSKSKSKSKPKSKPEPKSEKDESENVLNYGLTIASKGQEGKLTELDEILRAYSSFSVHTVSVSEKGTTKAGIFSGDSVSPAELESSRAQKEVLEGKCVAYWTTLAPNVEDYSSSAARLIASGSGQLIKGILWCGDVTMDRLKWGNEVMKRRMSYKSDAEVSPETMKRIRRVKRMTKMTEKVATGVLSGVVKVSGMLTGAVANSKVGKKFFGLIPGEIVLASLDGFNKVCDALEVSGRHVMSTSSDVTTELVSHRYGEPAGKATNEGLDAAGHAIGTAWAVFKVRKALNPKSVLKPSTLAKSAARAAAAEKSKKSK